MVHTNVFRCALLSLKPGTIHGILQLKAEVDQVIKYAIKYSTYQHVFCMCGGVRPDVNSAMPTCTHIAVQRKCAIPVQQKSSFCALKSYLLYATKHILCQFTVIHCRIGILLHVLSICRTTRVAYAPIAIRRFVNRYGVCEKVVILPRFYYMKPTTFAFPFFFQTRIDLRDRVFSVARQKFAHQNILPWATVWEQNFDLDLISRSQSQIGG